MRSLAAHQRLRWAAPAEGTAKDCAVKEDYGTCQVDN